MNFLPNSFSSNLEQLSSSRRKAIRPKSIHICSYCYKALSSKQNLKEHKYTHTGEKPYTCTEKGCGQKFRQGSQFSTHKKIHIAIKSHGNTNRNGKELKVCLMQLTELLSKDEGINKNSYETIQKNNNEALICLPPIQKQD